MTASTNVARYRVMSSIARDRQTRAVYDTLQVLAYRYHFRGQLSRGEKLSFPDGAKPVKRNPSRFMSEVSR